MCIQIDLITLHRCRSCHSELNRTLQTQCRCRVCSKQQQQLQQQQHRQQRSTSTPTVSSPSLTSDGITNSNASSSANSGAITTDSLWTTVTSALVPARPDCTVTVHRHEVISSYSTVSSRPCEQCLRSLGGLKDGEGVVAWQSDEGDGLHD